MKNTLPKLKGSLGFSLLEMIIVVSVLGVLSMIAVPIFSKVRDNSRNAKLNQDVRVINSAIIGYLGMGGNLDGLSNSGEVFQRLKVSLSDEDREALVGFGGSTLDERLAVRTVEQVSYTPSKAVIWNSSAKRFEITANSSNSAIAEFYLEDTPSTDSLVSNTMDRGAAFEYNRDAGWVWQYDEATPQSPLQPTLVTTTTPTPTTFVPTGPEIDVAETSTVAATVGTNIAINPGFEEPIAKQEAVRFYGSDLNAYYIDQSHITGWNTTGSDGLIEIWESGFNGVDAYQGDHFVEFNATEVATLYQLVDTEGANSVRIFFAHGQRSKSTEQLKLYVGRTPPAKKTSVGQVEDLEAQGFELVMQTASNSVGGWTTYAEEYHFEDDVSELYFAFQSVGEFSSKSVGNFLDEVSFQAVVGIEVTGLQVNLSQGSSISNIIESGSVKLTGFKPGDQLDINGALPDSLSYSIFANPAAEEITISIDGEAFRWVYENAFSKVRFTTTSDDTSSRSLIFSADDGYAVSQPTTFEITL